ncbi:hypothetical protein [Sanguibacter massiliensis]|uniref:hypothetical protein n=1 Tax=Sanguibacter massiliensis TaxID=1973217 RepID=UPI000C83C3A7|nr:hypothetical protein [Sanguibacter massiliensis]
MATTTIQPLPYPAPGDAPDIPRDLKALAEAVEDRTIMRFATTAARDAAIPSGRRMRGMVAYVEATATTYIYDQGGWWVLWRRPAWVQAQGTDVQYTRVGQTVTVAVDISGASGLTGDVVTLNGGAPVLPAEAVPAMESYGSGIALQPSPTTIHSATVVITPGGVIKIVKPSVATTGMRGTATYIAAS